MAKGREMAVKTNLAGAKSGKELVKLFVQIYGIKPGAGMVLIQIAAQALDTALQAESIVKEHGMVVMGERGLRPNPACGISRDARNRMLAALAKLNLEL